MRQILKNTNTNKENAAEFERLVDEIQAQLSPSATVKLNDVIIGKKFWS